MGATGAVLIEAARPLASVAAVGVSFDGEALVFHSGRALRTEGRSNVTPWRVTGVRRALVFIAATAAPSDNGLVGLLLTPDARTGRGRVGAAREIVGLAVARRHGLRPAFITPEFVLPRCWMRGNR